MLRVGRPTLVCWWCWWQRGCECSLCCVLVDQHWCGGGVGGNVGVGCECSLCCVLVDRRWCVGGVGGNAGVSVVCVACWSTDVGVVVVLVATRV